MTTETRPRRVCLPWGSLPTGQRVRAVCSCGYRGNPRVDESRALEALLTQHGFSQPVCQLCGKDHHGHSWEDLCNRYVQILTDPAIGYEFLVCRDMPKACRDGAAQRQVHLDRAAAEAFEIEMRRPKLRIVGGRKPWARRGCAS